MIIILTSKRSFNEGTKWNVNNGFIIGVGDFKGDEWVYFEV